MKTALLNITYLFLFFCCTKKQENKPVINCVPQKIEEAAFVAKHTDNTFPDSSQKGKYDVAYNLGWTDTVINDTIFFGDVYLRASNIADIYKWFVKFADGSVDSYTGKDVKAILSSNAINGTDVEIELHTQTKNSCTNVMDESVSTKRIFLVGSGGFELYTKIKGKYKGVFTNDITDTIIVESKISADLNSVGISFVGLADTCRLYAASGDVRLLETNRYYFSSIANCLNYSILAEIPTQHHDSISITMLSSPYDPQHPPQYMSNIDLYTKKIFKGIKQ